MTDPMGIETVGYPAALEELVAQFEGLLRQDRIDLLVEYANSLPPVPPELLATRDANQVHECMTPVWVWAQPGEPGPRIHVEVNETAPTIKAVAAVLIEGCAGATPAQILAIPEDLPVRIIGPDMVGQRRFGLAALIRHIKRKVGALEG